MQRIKRGWELTKRSWSILRANPALIRFPVFGGVLAGLVTLITIAPAAYLIEEEIEVAGIALGIVGIYIATVIGYFFSVGLAASADAILQGTDPGHSGHGMSVARSRWRQVAGWAALATVVATVLDLVRERAGILGAILGSAIGMGWALISFMALPVITIEGLGPFATLKRSAEIFREKWGQQVTGNVAIGGIAVILGVIPGLALFVGGIAIWASSGFAGAVLVVLGAMILVVAMVIQRAMSVIFGVALYHYALEGAPIGGFTEQEMEMAVRLKDSRQSSTVAGH